MVTLKDKVQTALDENRMLVLVVQVLIGFQCKGVFEPGFAYLPIFSQRLKLVAFCLLLLTLGLLLMSAAYHRIVEHGEDTQDFHEFVTGVMEWALLPFALGFGIDFFVPASKVLGAAGGVIAAVAVCSCALFFWYGIEALRNRHKPREVKSAMPQTEKTELKDKIKQVLTECRVVLPGTQALLGFQLIVFLTDAFEKLPHSLQVLHLASLGVVALSAILLMTPAAYHRLVERGEDTPHFHDLASRFLLAAMVPLALGVAFDFYIVTFKITNSSTVAGTFAALVLTLFYGLWFAFPLWRRASQSRHVIIEATR